jgi:5-methylcytosine-specific restriction endonuclease McrA
MGNPESLLRAAFFKTKDEIAQLIAERFPRPGLPERLEWLSPPSSVPATVEGPPSQLSPGTVQVTSLLSQPSTGLPVQLSPGTVDVPAPRGRMTRLAPQRVAFQFTGDQETGELYEQYRALVSHEIPSGEMALVYKDALRIAVAERSKRKFAATNRPGHSRGSANPRHIPASVKRAVSERDQRRCTFVSESGKRCDERGVLEYDHAEPVACGGTATVDNVRLLCRAHNQHAAERAFGAEFMDKKREEAKGEATPARAPVPAARS